MSIVCPTVTSESITELTRQLETVKTYASRIHIDLMDGLFTPAKSPDIIFDENINDSVVDFHIMYKNPTYIVERLLELKPNLLIVHFESDVDINNFISLAHNKGVKAGLALLPDTQTSEVADYLKKLDHVLVFGGHLGYQGGEADLNQLNKLKQIKEYNKDLEMSWDGGVNQSNIAEIANSGADIINVGKAIHGSNNPQNSYMQLQSLVE